nr:DNA/RNA polymerases superfamily protein [Tanacetum cinerariifolium]
SYNMERPILYAYLTNWQSRMPAQSATPYWQTAFPSHPDTYNPNLQPSIERQHDAAGLLNQISWIKEAQKEDIKIWTIVENLDKQTEFRLDEDDVLWQGTRLCVPNDASLREALLAEAHSSPFSIHPGSTKMTRLSTSGLVEDVATFISKCLICQRVKIEHQRASGLLQPLDIPVWKWDEISMDFVTGLPRTQRRHDAIWVVVDRLTKSAHFLPIRKDYSVNRDPRFASRFWKGLQKAWGTRLKFSTAFHPQTDGQSKRTIQTLEDMLRSCALE